MKTALLILAVLGAVALAAVLAGFVGLAAAGLLAESVLHATGPEGAADE